MIKCFLTLFIAFLIFNDAIFGSELDNKTITTTFGATVRVSSGFQVQRIPNSPIIKLEDPDKAIDTFFIETEGSDSEQAIKAAWESALPPFDRRIYKTTGTPWL